MNHREILQALLDGKTIKLTSRVSVADEANPFRWYVKMIGSEIVSRYDFESATFGPLEPSSMLFAYDAEVVESGENDFELPKNEDVDERMPRASAYTDGKEIRLFFGSADEISIDAYHKMKKLSSFSLTVTP